jgi:hypothetical protein
MALSRSVLITLAAALALAACGQPAEAPPSAAPPVAAPPAPMPETALAVSALTEADIAANPIDGELACGFATDAGTMLLAKGIVASTEPAQGLTKAGGVVQRLTAPGGFDGMLKGASFTGAGATVTIAVTGPATGGGESPPSPANLTYAPADGQSVTLPGSWTCGP